MSQPPPGWHPDPNLSPEPQSAEGVAGPAGAASRFAAYDAPAEFTHRSCTSSRSSTKIDIQTPLSDVSSPSGPNVATFDPFPGPPCPPRQRKIS
jgi:hypothetical protein